MNKYIIILFLVIIIIILNIKIEKFEETEPKYYISQEDFNILTNKVKSYINQYIKLLDNNLIDDILKEYNDSVIKQEFINNIQDTINKILEKLELQDDEFNPFTNKIFDNLEIDKILEKNKEEMKLTIKLTIIRNKISKNNLFLLNNYNVSAILSYLLSHYTINNEFNIDYKRFNEDLFSTDDKKNIYLIN
jgi:hypothetical protein